MMTFVIDNKQKALNPCKKEEADSLLENRDAVIHRYAPLTIQLKKTVNCDTRPLILKIFPDIKTTGMAVLEETHEGVYDIVYLLQINHRSDLVNGMLKRHKYMHWGKKNTPPLNYQDRLNMMKRLYDANLDEITQCFNKIEKWLPIGEVIMHRWQFHHYTSALRRTKHVLPKDFSVKIGRLDLYCGHYYYDNFKQLFQSETKIVEEGVKTALKKCEYRNLPKFPSYRALVLGETDHALFKPRTGKIKVWTSRRKGKCFKQIPSSKNHSKIGLYDIVTADDGYMALTGKCIGIDEDRKIIVQRGIYTRTYPIEQLTLLQKDEGWDYTTMPSHNVFYIFNR